MLAAGWSLEGFAAFILIASIKGTLLAAAVLLVQKAGARWLSANSLYLLWLPVVLALLTPLGIPTELPLLQQPSTREADLLPAAGPARNIDAGGTNMAAPTPGSASSGPILTAAMLEPAVVPPAETLLNAATVSYALSRIWLAGVVIVLILVATAQRRVSAMVQRATPALPAHEQLLADCRQQAACGTKVRVLYSSEVAVPMITGVFRPVLLLPTSVARQLSHAQLRHVYMHELMHLMRRDIVVNWIVALAQALHWFNPAVWYATHCLRQDRELACDSATLQHLGPAERASYGHTLLQLNDAVPAHPVPAVAVGILERPAHLQRRIHMLVRHPRLQRLQSLLLGLLLAPLAAVALSQPMPVRQAPDAPHRAVAAPAAPLPAQAAAAPDAALAITPTSEVAGPATVNGSDAAVPELAPATMRAPIPAVAAEPARAELYAMPAVSSAPAEAAPIIQLAQLDVAQEPVAAAPATPATIAPSTPAAPATQADADAGLAVIRQLGDDIASIKADQIRFIEKWNDMGKACEARKDSFFGVLSASCQRIRTAMRNGDILGFGYQCFLLNSIHAQQREQYGEQSAAQPELPAIANALDANEAELATFCSKETYDEQYPAFASILADAETHKYPPPQMMANNRVNPPWNGGQRWVDMVTSTSMISHIPGSAFTESTRLDSSMYSAGPFSPSNPAGGSGMGGDMSGGMGGSMGGSPGADAGAGAGVPTP